MLNFIFYYSIINFVIILFSVIDKLPVLLPKNNVSNKKFKFECNRNECGFRTDYWFSFNEHQSMHSPEQQNKDKRKSVNQMETKAKKQKVSTLMTTKSSGNTTLF